MQDTYDPYSFLLSEIRAYDSGERENWDPYQRQHYLDVLLVDEAEEIAWGRHHVTVVHGKPKDEVEAELLDEIFSAWEDIALGADWSRIGGVSDHHLTFTVGASDATALILASVDVAIRCKPRHWQIVETACPSPSLA